MLKRDVKDHFGTYVAAADALGITKSAISQWPEIVPELWAYKIQAITRGRLKIDPLTYQQNSASRAPTGGDRAA
jgi:transcriptional regulator with XRE-family HTH domain